MNNKDKTKQIFNLLDSTYQMMYQVSSEFHSNGTLSWDNKDLILSGLDQGNEDISNFNLTSMRQKLFHLNKIVHESDYENIWRDFLSSLMNIQDLGLKDDDYISLRPILPSVYSNIIDTYNNIGQGGSIIAPEFKYGLTMLHYVESKTHRAILSQEMLDLMSSSIDTQLEQRYLTHIYNMDDVDRINMFQDEPFFDLLLRVMVKNKMMNPMDALKFSMAKSAEAFPKLPTKGCRIVGTDILELVVNENTRSAVFNKLNLQRYFSVTDKIYCFPITQDYILLIPSEHIVGLDLPLISAIYLMFNVELTGIKPPLTDLLFSEYSPFQITMEGSGQYDVDIRDIQYL